MSQPVARRIIHVPRRFATQEWGGTESVILHLARQQQAQGWVPEIHTSRALCPTPRETWQGLPIFRYRYCYPFWGLTKAENHALDKKGGNLLSLDLFWHLVTRPQVRLFHAHVTKRMGGSVLVAARRQRKPCVVTLHGNVFDVPPDEAGEVNAAQRGHFEWGRPFGALFRSRQLLDEADAVLCVGYSEFEKARAALPHPRVHFLPNGVDPARVAGGDRDATRARLGLPPEAIVIGCLSRIDRQKGQLTLLQALAAARRRQPHLRLVLCGPATQPDYRDQLQRTIGELGLSDCVTLLPGATPESAEWKGLWAAFDIFALASRHEPFGIVVLEAWASRLPVLVSDVGGLRALVRDGTDGQRLPPADPAAWAEAIVALAADAPRRAAWGANGRGRVLAEFTWERVAGQLEAIYQQAEARVADTAARP